MNQTFLFAGSGTAPATLHIVTCRVDCTAAARTLTLPDASTMSGGIIVVVKIDSSANAVTVARTSSQTINGAASNGTIAGQWGYIWYQSDGANWVVIG